MAIPFKSEEQAHRGFLQYQKELEQALAQLHNNVDAALNNIIARNTNKDGTIDKAKIKLIVDKYMAAELNAYKRELTAQIKAGVADSASMGVRSIIGAVAPHRNVTSTIWTDTASRIRKNILNLRGIDGLTLSDRIWKLTQDNTFELKKLISGGILQGRSAARISRDIRGFLKQPDTLRGKAKDDYHPGTGTYKSAYKNAMRVTRTETNQAYIDGQTDTAKIMGYKMQFQVSGINVCDKCAALNGKVFDPDDFPAPVHPHCMCHPLTVLPD